MQQSVSAKKQMFANVWVLFAKSLEVLFSVHRTNRLSFYFKCTYIFREARDLIFFCQDTGLFKASVVNRFLGLVDG